MRVKRYLLNQFKKQFAKALWPFEIMRKLA